MQNWLTRKKQSVQAATMCMQPLGRGGQAGATPGSDLANGGVGQEAEAVTKLRRAANSLQPCKVIWLLRPSAQ